MKSIKEKAKAYDEAIKRAQAKMEEAKVFDYDDEQTAHTIRLTTTDIFPELKEGEDERIRKGIIRNLEYLADRAEGFVKDELKERIAWLEKQGEQKPADTEKGAKGNEREIPNSAWSEEDESFRLRTIGALETCKIGSPTKCVDEQINWLKSLKERVQHQLHWKPSKEQLQALRWVCNRTFIVQEPQKESALEDLYEQLRAL